MDAKTTTRQMVFSVPEGGEVLITYPEPMTPDSILMVEELCAIWFRGLHRRSIQRSREDDAEVEYASWFPLGYDVTPTVNEHGETPEQEAFCDRNCCWSGHHPDCVRAAPDGGPEAMNLTQAAQDVLAERARQDAKWGGPAHDDHHSVAEWVQLIEDYAGWARVMAGMNSQDKARRRLIQVAALAVAAVEAMDRPRCGNCDTAVPPGCGGQFKDDGDQCALNRTRGVGGTDASL